MRQDGHQHAAIEQHADQAGGDRRAVAAQQAEAGQQEHQAMGDATGAQVHAARIAQHPRAEARTQPQQGQGTHGGFRIHAAGEGAEDQDRDAVGGDMLDRGMQHRAADQAEQALGFQRRDRPRSPVERALQGEHGHQHQHGRQADIERPQDARAVIAGGRHVAGGQGRVVVHTSAMAVAGAKPRPPQRESGGGRRDNPTGRAVQPVRLRPGLRLPSAGTSG